MAAGGEVQAEAPGTSFTSRSRRRVPTAMAAVVAAFAIVAVLPGTAFSPRDLLAAAGWAVVLGVGIGLIASLPVPQGRWWRWAAPALATAASIPVLYIAEIVLWFAGGGDVRLFEPTADADAWWYPTASAVLAVSWVAAAGLGVWGAGRRRRHALAPLAFAVVALGVLAVLVTVT